MSNSNLFLKSGFINVPLQNGVGRYVCQLQRVVLKFCKNNGSSRGMREFIESELINFAKENPGTVVYLKPRRHRSPIIKAEFLNGETQWLSVNNFTRDEISKWLNLFRTQQVNHTGTRIRKLWHTDHPSIQGPWTPFTFRDLKLNFTQFPNDKIGRLNEQDHQSYEELLKLFEEQNKKMAETAN